MEQSLLIGKVVEYTITKDKKSRGLVIDKIDKKEKIEDNCSVTGYLIQDNLTKELTPVSHWRVIRILWSDKEEQADSFDSMPQGNIPGGYIRSK